MVLPKCQFIDIKIVFLQEDCTLKYGSLTVRVLLVNAYLKALQEILLFEPIPHSSSLCYSTGGTVSALWLLVFASLKN